MLVRVALEFLVVLIGEMAVVAVALVKMVDLNLVLVLVLVLVVMENNFLSVILTITGVEAAAVVAGMVVREDNQEVMVD
tara:strand:- start:40 stop:276 length:237 start_codon:yes stop_codon:yes gene_type:complete